MSCLLVAECVLRTLTLAVELQLLDAECERKRLQETMDTDFVPRDTVRDDRVTMTELECGW